MSTCELVDLEDSVEEVKVVEPTQSQLHDAVVASIRRGDIATLSLKVLRQELETHFQLPPGTLSLRREEIKRSAQTELEVMQKPVSGAEQNVEVMQTPVAAAEQNVVVNAVPAVTTSDESVLPASTPTVPTQKRKSLLSEPAAKSLLSEPAALKQKCLKDAGVSVVSGEKSQNASSKQKKPKSAYLHYMSAVSSKISADLKLKSSTGKFSFAEVAKETAAQWKVLPEADKAIYEKLAADEKASLPNIPADGKVQTDRKLKAKAKAKGKSKGSLCTLTREDFLKAGKRLCLTSSFTPGNTQEGDGEENAELIRVDVEPRLFGTGSVGWSHCRKLSVDIMGESLTVQAQVNFTVIGSKTWENGGLDTNVAVPMEAEPTSQSAEPISA